MSETVTCAPRLRNLSVPVFSCWLGGNAVTRARQIFVDAGIPTYETPEQAAAGYLQGMQYRRNQEILFETPSAAVDAFVPKTAAVRTIIDAALCEKRTMLSEPEAKAVLRAYGIPVVETRIAADAGEAAQAAAELGYPVVLKILSPDLSHKSDVGGVALDIRSPEMLAEAAGAMLARVRDLRPQALLKGFAVQNMIARPHALDGRARRRVRRRASAGWKAPAPRCGRDRVWWRVQDRRSN